MEFTAKAGTRAYLGAMPIVFREDTVMEAPEAANFDHLAAMMASAGQRVFGDHLSSLAHNETVTRMVDGEASEVDVTVTYGAGGARQEKDQGEPRKKAKVFAEPVPEVPTVPVSPDTPTSPSPADPLTAARATEFQERTEFRPPPKRFPDEIQTATDHPVDQSGQVATAPAEETVEPVATDAPAVDEDELPEDFPHRDLLETAGVTKFSQIEGKTVEELSSDDFPGIGPTRAEDIFAALKNRERAN